MLFCSSVFCVIVPLIVVFALYLIAAANCTQHPFHLWACHSDYADIWFFWNPSLKIDFRWQQEFCHGRTIQHVSAVRMSDLAAWRHFLQIQEILVQIFFYSMHSRLPLTRYLSLIRLRWEFPCSAPKSNSVISQWIKLPECLTAFSRLPGILYICRCWIAMTPKPWWGQNTGIPLYLPSERWISALS